MPLQTRCHVKRRGKNVPEEKQVLSSFQEMLTCSTVGNLKTMSGVRLLLALQYHLRQNAEKAAGQET